jgi:prepilin signal peptidase PulO-like enzyme (type II secretory pathway)
VSTAAPAAPRATQSEWWHEVPREPVGPGKTVVTAVGGAVAGLGALALFAASVTWLTAWTESLDVNEDECPNHQCEVGTRGGDAYESARDLAHATDVLLAVSLPAIAGGLSTLIIGATLREPSDSSYARVTVQPTGAGARMEVTF